jgi:DNA-directed RNA polymerase specialized sigma24 family protein
VAVPPTQTRTPRPRASLSGTGFEKLLALLDPDRERAGREYEAIRGKLVKFFHWRGRMPAEELADETIDRVCWRLGQGERIRGGDPFLYFHGVAKNVLREAWQGDHRQKKRHQAIDQVESTAPDRSSDPDEVDRAAQFERRLECLQRCLEHLEAEEQTLIRRYYRDQGAAKIENRRRMAEELDIPLNALRIRIHRIRVRLAGCVRDTLRRVGEG